MTYSEVKSAENAMMEAKKNYKNMVFDFLYQNLIEAGFGHNKLVMVKDTKEKGVLWIDETDMFVPYTIKFHPIRKDGLPSQKAKIVTSLWSYKLLSDECVEHLKSVFETADIE